MTISLDEMRKRFRERGVRMTPQRAAIYGALAGTTSHPTAEDLYREVKKIHPMISQNTVYYTLGVLREAGLVREVNYWHDRSRFDANIGLHHHLICLGCRKIEDLMDATLDRLSVRVGSRLDFEVTGHRVEFHGYCAACRRRKKPGAAPHHLGHHSSSPHTSVQRRRER